MNKIGLDSTEIIFASAIAFLYPFFFSKLTDNITGYNTISNMCDKISYPDSMNCYNTRAEKIKQPKLKKHVILVVIALFGIILSGFIKTKSTKLGLGLGGLITLIYTITMYWDNYDETIKLVILGCSFLIVLWLSVRLYSINNIADIFTIEFGTK